MGVQNFFSSGGYYTNFAAMTTFVRKVVLASPHGFCAGVERAIQMAEAALRLYPHPVYCLKQIVHNQQVIDSLAAKGMTFVEDITEVPRGATVLFSAHGVPPQTRKMAAELNLRVVDATCPFVTKVHQEVKRYAADNYTILLIGHPTHDEIIGVAGEAPKRVKVIANEEKARTIRLRDRSKVAVLTQTTLSVDDVARILGILKRRFPALETPQESDICYATRNRQEAVRKLAPDTDGFIVLGAENSSNSNRLVEVAKSMGCATRLVSRLEQLRDIPHDICAVLGVTAGASTPESFVKEAIALLLTMEFSVFEERVVVKEDIHFALPKELQSAP